MTDLLLTPRLQLVASLVPAGARLADVGTDHAHLPVWLLQEGRIPSAIASDIRKGPLERAAATVAEHHASDRIQLRLCPGLAAIQPHEVDTVTICGMGGEVMMGILEAAPWTKHGVTLILQPQSVLPKLRRWLVENGYVIRREYITKEAHRWYPVLVVEGGASRPLTDGECLAGAPEAWQDGQNEPLRVDYLRFLLERTRKEYSAMTAAGREDERSQELARCITELEGWMTPKSV